MHLDLWVALAGLVVGFVVGLTGMGGGALMTPILVLGFGIQPLAAVSSDLIAAVVMKPIGGAVHLHRGKVNRRLVLWLCIGSVPSAFVGVLTLELLGTGADLQDKLKLLLGVALLLAATSMAAKAMVESRRAFSAKTARTVPEPDPQADAETVTVKPWPTLLIGVAGGLIVGMTSVGSGSLMIVLLLFLYPRLRASQLVGTDLVQAIPLVAAAAIGHLLFGDFKLDLTTSLLIGSVPGVYVGARVSVRAPDHLIRPALMFVLVVSALKLLGVGNVATAAVMGALLVLGSAVAVGLRRSQRRLAVALDAS